MTYPILRRVRRPGSRPLIALVASALLVVGLGALLHPAQAARVPDAAPAVAVADQSSCPTGPDTTAAMTSAAYARVDGIAGDATKSWVVGQIALAGVSIGACSSVSTGGAGVGVTSFDPLVMVKRIDVASPPLLAKEASGTHIATATISVWTESGTPRQVLSYDLTNVVVLSVKQVQRSNSLTEEVALGYTRVALTFHPLNPDGTAGTPVRACWDRVANVTC